MAQQYIVQVNSTQEKVYRTLRDEIISMKLEPGTVISTQETADRLGVSRTPVREAFIRLQRENLLEITPQRATMVAHIDLERVYQERFIREALEIENLDRFVTIHSERTFEKMRRSIERQKIALKEKEYAEYIELDNEFHRLSLRETGERLGAEIMNQMNGHYDRIRLLTCQVEKIVTKAIEEHVQLLEACRARDVVQAKRILRGHLQQLFIQEEFLVETWPNYFKKDI